jgi:hypothetical protein
VLYGDKMCEMIAIKSMSAVYSQVAADGAYGLAPTDVTCVSNASTTTSFAGQGKK